MTNDFDAYHIWMGIPREEQPPHYYRLLGIELFEGNMEVIEKAADRQSLHLRSFQTGQRAALSQRLLNEVAAAAGCLLDPAKKLAYDTKLAATLEAKKGGKDAEPLPVVSLVSIAAAPVARVKSRAASKGGKVPTRLVVETIKIVGGGLLGLFLGMLVVSYFFGLDSLPWRKKSPEGTAKQSVNVKSQEKGRGSTQAVESPIEQPQKAVDFRNRNGALDSSPNRSSKDDATVENTPPAPTASPLVIEGADPSPAQFREDNGLGMRFVMCPSGNFLMGSPDSDIHAIQREQPQVSVTLTRDFWLGETEVTQGQWEQVMTSAPWRGKDFVQDLGTPPATYVSWVNAVEFCDRMNSRESQAGRLPSGWAYRLPTEAEWEYACRAGTRTRYSFGDDDSQLNDFGWWGGVDGDGNAKAERFPHPVGLKKANPWGLKDMHGNVHEWCRDTKVDSLPGGIDPIVTSGGAFRIFRGGSWVNFAHTCRSAYCGWYAPDAQKHFVGFRVALCPLSTNRLTVLSESTPPKSGAPSENAKPSPNYVRLVDLETIEARVGFGEFRKNVPQIPGGEPMIGPKLDFAVESLYAHAPSKLVYKVPPAQKSFTVVGYSPSSRHLRFSISNQNQQIAESGSGSVHRFKVNLPERTTEIHLGVDDLGIKKHDQAFWCYPRLHQQPADKIDAFDSKERCVPLTEKKPLLFSVGADNFLINKGPAAWIRPLHPDSIVPCDEYLCAHADSRISYVIPAGMTRFSAIAYAMLSKSVRFRVLVDDIAVAEVKRAGIEGIKVNLPTTGKALTLVTESLGDGREDHAYWCYPRFARQ